LSRPATRATVQFPSRRRFRARAIAPGARLLEASVLTVTPHIAAQAIASLMVEQVVDNIRSIERGDAPTGRVDVERGY